MSPFVPPEYLSFDDAIDRVAEIAMLARDPGSVLTQDEKSALQGVRARKAWVISQGRPGVTPASYPEPLLRLEITKEEFKKIMNKEAAMKEQRLLAKEELQKLLYAEQVPSVTITENGSCHPTPGYIWGGKQWYEALSSDWVTFPNGSGSSVSGRPLIPKDALEAAFNADGTPRSTAEASSAQEAPMPRHQYRTRLLDVLEQIWSKIDASDWKTSPPKKASIETDLKKRFSLSDREAGMIATMFVPDNRRGKAKKG